MSRNSSAACSLPPTLPEVTQAVWDLRHSLTGSVTEAIIFHTYQDTSTQSSACCPQCDCCVQSRGSVRRSSVCFRRSQYWKPRM